MTRAGRGGGGACGLSRPLDPPPLRRHSPAARDVFRPPRADWLPGAAAGDFRECRRQRLRSAVLPLQPVASPSPWAHPGATAAGASPVVLPSPRFLPLRCVSSSPVYLHPPVCPSPPYPVLPPSRCPGAGRGVTPPPQGPRRHHEHRDAGEGRETGAEEPQPHLHRAGDRPGDEDEGRARGADLQSGRQDGQHQHLGVGRRGEPHPAGGHHPPHQGIRLRLQGLPDPLHGARGRPAEDRRVLHGLL